MTYCLSENTIYISFAFALRDEKMSWQAFYLGKVRITIKKMLNNEIVIDDVYEFIAPHDDRDEFQTVMLSKRFLQVQSLTTTRPWNITKKLQEAIDVRFSLEFVEGNYHYAAINETEKKLYIWRTNNGYEVYIVEDDCDRIFTIFTTSTNKKYCVVINRKFIADLIF